jgi:hypothetical protein
MNSGRLADAQAADDLAGAMSPHLAMMPMGESMMTMGTSVLLRFGRYDELLGQPEPPEDRPVLHAWWRFARGVALARTGKPDEATAERKALAEATTKVPDSALFRHRTHVGAFNSRAGRALLDARIAEARGRATGRSHCGDKRSQKVMKFPTMDSDLVLSPQGVARCGAARGRQAGGRRAGVSRKPDAPRAMRGRCWGLKASLDRQGKESAWVAQAFESGVEECG